MTPDEINRRVAEILGYKWSVPHYTHAKRWEVTLCKDGGHWRKEDSEWAGYPPVFEGCYQDLGWLPKYSTCLNACASMEATLDEMDQIRFASFLYDETVPEHERFADHFIGWPQASRMIAATARQRALAFIRVHESTNTK